MEESVVKTVKAIRSDVVFVRDNPFIKQPQTTTV